MLFSKVFDTAGNPGAEVWGVCVCEWECVCVCVCVCVCARVHARVAGAY